MKNKRSRFWTFWWSFLPGAAEMYMGFMKMGLSLMVIFWGMVALTTFLSMGPLMYLVAIAWFYSFFHAQNLATASDEAFAGLKDEYLFHLDQLFDKDADAMKKNRKIIALVLIVLGGVMLLGSFGDLLSRFLPQFNDIYNMVSWYVPRLVVGVAIIALGVHMIQGKKEEILEEEYEQEESDDIQSEDYAADFLKTTAPGEAYTGEGEENDESTEQ